MTRVIAVAVAALLVVAAPGRLMAQCSESDKAALVAFDKAWTTATRAGDRTQLESILSAGFAAHGNTGTTDKATTIANAVRNAAARTASSPPAGTSDHYQVSCAGSTATITHRSVTPPAAGSTNPPFYGRAIHFLEKRGNQWQVVSSTVHQLSDAAILAYMELDWNDASRNRDVAWHQANYADFAFEVSSRNAELTNKGQSIEAVKNDKRVFESLVVSNLSSRVDGDMAVVTGINHAKGRDAEGKPMDRRVRFTDTFIKKNGRWLIWSSQATQIP